MANNFTKYVIITCRYTFRGDTVNTLINITKNTEQVNSFDYSYDNNSLAKMMVDFFQTSENNVGEHTDYYYVLNVNLQETLRIRGEIINEPFIISGKNSNGNWPMFVTAPVVNNKEVMAMMKQQSTGWNTFILTKPEPSVTALSPHDDSYIQDYFFWVADNTQLYAKLKTICPTFETIAPIKLRKEPCYDKFVNVLQSVITDNDPNVNPKIHTTLLVDIDEIISGLYNVL